MKLKFCINILLLLLVLTGAVNASNGDKNRKTLCGKVVDRNTGEVLAGVKVQVKDSDTYCYSDFNGNYVLSISADKKAEIVVEGMGYEQNILKSDDLGFGTDINLTPLR